ncbi:hypothetical protein BKA70DRAFT_1034840, partial [Coprinopsis sp. MPI-PUGE-AT-0042]
PQINLVVGDYLKDSDDDLVAYTNKAGEVITWLCGKTMLMAIIRETYSNHNGGKKKTILRAVISHWTSHYMSYDRLLQMRHIIKLVIDSDSIKPPQEQRVVIGDSAAQERARAMVQIIIDPAFWHGL